MMTTPERLRRRQLIEGGTLIVIGIALLLQSWYFNIQDRDQRACLADNFAALSQALDVRSEASNQETEAEKRIWLTYAQAAGALKDKPPLTELPRKEQAKLRQQLIDDLLNYQDVIVRIERERKEHPVPPYPAGECQ